MGIIRFAALIIASIIVGPSVVEAQTTITNVSVLDVENGVILSNRTVVIEDGLIAAVSLSEEEPPSADGQIIDGTGKFLIPGLIDMHVHTDRSGLPLFLEFGVTTVRDMGTHFAPLEAGSLGQLAMRSDIANGTADGPELFLALRILDGIRRNRWLRHFAYVETPEDGAAIVDQIAEAGGDFVKVYTDLAPDVFQAVATRARERNLPLVGHVPGRVGYAQAIDAGLSTAEHLRGFFIDASSEEDFWRERYGMASLSGDASETYALANGRLLEMADTYDPAKAEALFTMLRDNGVGIVPTLVVLDDPRWQYPSARPDPALVARLSNIYGNIVTPSGDPRGPYATVSDGLASLDRQRQLVVDMHRAGVAILVGTDASNPFVLPGISLHEELAQLVAAGLTNAEVLRAATILNAQFLAAEDRIGSIAVGKEADLVLLRSNPLLDIAATRNIEAVFVDGKIVRTEADEDTVTE